MTLSTDIKLDNITSQLRRGWHWWISELWDLLPAVLFNALAPKRPNFSIEVVLNEIVLKRTIDGTSAEIARFTESDLLADPSQAQYVLPTGIDTTEPIVVRIHDSEVLTKHLQLPIAPLKDLRQIAKHEVERQNPVAAEQVEFRTRVVRKNRGAGLVDLDVYVIERETIRRVGTVCRALGFSPGSIEPLQNAAADWVIPLAARPTVRSLLRRYSLPALAGLTVALGLTALIFGFVKDLGTAQHLAAEVRIAKAEADSVAKLRDEITAARNELNFLAQRKEAGLAINTIASLTSIVPEDAWLFSLDLSGTEIHVRGFSPSASNLIKLIDQSQEFEGAEFRAPLMQGQPGGSERFDLAFKLTEPRK